MLTSGYAAVRAPCGSGQVEQLKRCLGNPKIDRGRMREYLIRLAYVEMLGQDAQFGHVHAVKLCSDADLLTKGVAYLATSLFINNQSELIFLVVNTIQTDLLSDNSLVCCLALHLVCRLVNPDVAPVLAPRVVELLGHESETVRKKAVIALHRCYQQDPSVLQDFDAHLRKMLCDKDPSVMGATLSAFGEAVKAAPDDYRNLAGSFVSILDQIIEGKLPRSYDYHKAPAPFLQIKILKILAMLGQGDKAASELIYEVVAKCLRVANTGSTIGNAVVYECVRTASAIFPNAHLLAASADVVAHFLRQPNNNLRYAAIDALGHIVRVNSQYAVEHQMAVIDCLEDPDASLRKKTLELLQKMTTADNVEVVVDKMVAFLEQARDDAIREDVVSRISEVAERFAPDNEWFVDTMTTVFRLGGDVVRPEAVQNFLGLMADGTGDGDAAADSELRSSATSSFLDLLAEEKPLHDPLLTVMAWVLGEYGNLCGTPAETVDALVDIGSRRNASLATTCAALSGIARACCQSGAALTAKGNEWLVLMVGHVDHTVATHAVEAQELILSPEELKRAVAPLNAASETLDFAGLGGIISSHVQDALNAGATPYIAAEIRRGPQEEKAEASTSLKFEAYEAYEPQAVAPVLSAGGGFDASALPWAGGAAADPGAPPVLAMDALGGLSLGGATGAAPAARAPPPASLEPTLNLRGPRKWGAPSPAPVPAAEPEPVAVFSAQAPGAVSAAPDLGLGSFAKDPVLSAAPAVQQEPPAELTEKQMLAQSLFGGGGGARRERRSTTTRRAPAQQAAPAPDLLDLGAPAPSAAPAAAASQDSLDFLGGMTLSTDSAAVPQAAPQAAGGFNLNALFSTPVTQQTPQAGMMQPGMGMAQPGIGMAQPGMGAVQPGMGMVQPGMGMAQPGMGMAQPGMGMAQQGAMLPGMGMAMGGMPQPGMGMAMGGVQQPGMGMAAGGVPQPGAMPGGVPQAQQGGMPDLLSGGGAPQGGGGAPKTDPFANLLG